MEIVVANTKEELKQEIDGWRNAGEVIGLVPTMGYLHEGHASLIRRARQECDRVVVSVFVNPTQFAPGEDLEAYPRDFEHDRQLCRQMGVDLIFHPTPEVMYPQGFGTTIAMDQSMTGVLCGKTRPTHFQGVCTVVCKLFGLTHADRAYFGQKDAQQLAIVRKMNRDLDLGVTIVGCPIVREVDGLAKSSRNVYLNPEERKAALVLSQAVKLGQEKVAQGETDADAIVAAMKEHIQGEPLAKIDYVEAVDDIDLRPAHTVVPGTLFAMAVYIGKTRLIDNFITEGDRQ